MNGRLLATPVNSYSTITDFTIGFFILQLTCNTLQLMVQYLTTHGAVPCKVHKRTSSKEFESLDFECPGLTLTRENLTPGS